MTYFSQRFQSLPLAAVVAATVAAGCGSPPRPEPAHSDPPVSQAPAARKGVLEGSYIVAFRGDSDRRPLAFSSFAQEYRRHGQTGRQRYFSDPRVESMRYLTAVDLAGSALQSWQPSFRPPRALQLAWGRRDVEPAVARLTRVDFTTPKAARQLLQTWKKQGRIWFAEPNGVSRVSTDSSRRSAQGNLFADYAETYKDFNYWWLKKTNLANAFETISGRDPSQKGVPSDQQINEAAPIVAILDSGVDYEHPALKGRIWTNPDVNAASCENDVHGCNTTVAEPGELGNGKVWPFGTSGPGQSCAGKDPNCSHGTHVAGIVAGRADWTDPATGRPTPGMCPICRIMVLKIVSKVGDKSGILDSSIIAAFKYISLFRREGSPAVRVVNASFGKFSRSRSVGLMVRLMKERHGTLVVGAAGNEDTLTMEYPAAFSDAIAVSAVNEDLLKVPFSNFGRWVDLSAPGQGIVSTIPGASTDTKSGTSMAAPMVSSTAGLMVARYPNISFDKLRHYLLKTADPSFYAKDHQGGFNYHYYYPKIEQDPLRQPLLGYGLVNTNAALRKSPSTGLPVFSEQDRVDRTCGVVTGSPASISGLVLLIFGLLGPTVALFFKGNTYAT